MSSHWLWLATQLCLVLSLTLTPTCLWALCSVVSLTPTLTGQHWVVWSDTETGWLVSVVGQVEAAYQCKGKERREVPQIAGVNTLEYCTTTCVPAGGLSVSDIRNPNFTVFGILYKWWHQLQQQISSLLWIVCMLDMGYYACTCELVHACLR